MRTSTATKTFVAAFAAVLMAVPRAARAGESTEVEELRREVRQLQGQLQALRTAITEAAEFDRQRAALLTRALKNIGGAETSAPRGEAPAPHSSAAAAEVRATPPPPARAEASAASSRRVVAVTSAPTIDTAVGTIRGKITVPTGEPVAYVYVENVLAPPVKGQHKTIEQTGKRFVPSWAVVQRGTSIAFPNQDNIYHNVFSLSSGNSFDLGLYNSGGEPKAHTFNEPGAVDVYCNIHPQMAASVLVVPNKLFAKVKADGSYEIPGVPTGRRKVVAWAPGSRLIADWVEVGAGANVDLNLRLDSKAGAHKNKAGQAYGSYE
ncbi:MAG TPA: carboxypeptidase regulatory-like domain-containing protein [Polyangia bacterium]|nr:carboxypeptidase regulatory-like domain-containing protein [Polyangia bacterium]